MARYGSAWSTIYSLRVQPWRDGGVVVTVDGLGVDQVGERCEAEYTVAEIALMLRAYTGGARPTLVRFAHPAPVRTDAHDRLFGPTLCFGAARTEIGIDAATLALPLRTARPGLAAILATQLNRMAAEGTTLRGLLDETRRSLALEMFNENRYLVKEVASALGFSSVRSLQRAYRRWTGTSPRGGAQVGRAAKAISMNGSASRGIAAVSTVRASRSTPTP